MDTTILPTPPTSGAIFSSGANGYDACVGELITNNNIADNGRAILTAIANGDAAIIAADQAGHLVNQKTTGDGTVASINATNLNGTANLKATYDAQVAAIEATNRNGLANVTSTERNSGEIRMNIAKEAGESRLATAIGGSEIRELIRETSTDNLIAIKDNGFAIREEGCKTREVVFAESCKTREVLGQKLWDLEKETLKGFADNKYAALENKCALAAQIAECCCENKLLQKETQSLILAQESKELERKVNRLETQLLVLSGGIISAKTV